MFGLSWGKKKDARQAKQSAKNETLPALLQRLKNEQLLLNFRGRSNVSAFDLQRFKELEERIISLLPDDFQKKVFQILLEHNVDLLEFFEGDWKDPLRAACEGISSYLDPTHPLNFVGDKLTVAGKDFLLWLLQQAKSGSSGEPIKNIAQAIKGGIICGHNISNETVEQVGSLVIVVLFSSEYGLQFRTLAEIMCDTEEGEDFIKNELLKKGQ